MLQHVSVYINHHQGALSLCFAKVTMLTSVTYRYLKLSVLWLHILFSPVLRVDRALCRFNLHSARSTHKGLDTINMHGATMKIMKILCSIILHGRLKISYNYG